MIPIIRAILFLLLGMFLVGCAAKLKCRRVCIPGEPCEKVCKPEEWWNDYENTIVLKKRPFYVYRPRVVEKISITKTKWEVRINDKNMKLLKD